MKIQSKKECWVPNPETIWSAGEIKEVSNEIGKKLLKNNNFVKYSATKPVIKSEIKNNVKYRS